MTIRFPRGAEWRVWDLQIHTPFSELSNGFGSDIEAYAANLFKKAISREIAVIGVTDYFVVDGYRYLKELQADGSRLEALIGKENVEAAQRITLFANVELRTDVLIDQNRVNYHVIFSDEISADDIENNFLSQLEIPVAGNPDGIDQKLSLTKANLTEIGKTLKAQHSKFEGQSDLFVGMMTATIDHRQVSEVLRQRDAKFGGRYVFCVPCDEDLSKVSWDGQGHLVRKVLIQKSHLLFASSHSTREFALGMKHATHEEYLSEFRSFKPCVHSSDAHSPEELFEPDESRLTWIKADPTFQGLLQILNEPDSRVYVGSCPPGLQSILNRPTKILRELSIHKKAGSPLTEKWFDHQLPLNPELVAIIGNKGSGKSALADVLGLIGNTPRHRAFSFLSAERFRDRKNNKAKHFEASATWADEKIDGPISLDDTPVEGSLETVKYIPQDYLERICNEVSLGSGSQFYAELQNVIFSHVPAEEQLGFSSLDDLLRHRSEETQRAIAFLVEQLGSINKELVSCEDQLTDAHRKALEAQVAVKQRELEAHDQLKPPAVQPPAEDPSATEVASQVGAELQDLQSRLTNIEQQLGATRQRLGEATRRRSTAERLLGKLANLQRQVQAATVEVEPDARELGLELEGLVRVQISSASVEAIRLQAVEDGAQCNQQLDLRASGSLAEQQKSIQESIGALATKLSAPQKAYEDHKALVKRWEEARETILGTAEQLGSLNQLKAAVASLPSIAERSQVLKRERFAKAREIYKEKVKLRDDYGRYYGAVQKFLAEHPLAKGQQFKLTFNVAISEQRFAASFLKLLNQRRVGTYAGLEEGAERLGQLLASTNFDVDEEVSRFLLRMIRSLREDQRPGRDNVAVDLKDQLAQGVSVANVYDYIFGLEYLEPVYSLRWDGKTLEQLSPGERGNLLLIFYLLIDRDDIPLVIDQPEENLDNHTVFRTLVPCVKEAKRRRQIILVTHNPNLAVVCDAEQVISAEIRKDKGNEVRYICGSIENSQINRKIVDILEGTRPAFDKRDSKYLP